MVENWTREGILVSTDKSRLDLDFIHGYLAGAYWCEEIPRAVVAKALANSLCFGAYDEATGAPLGLARMVSDYATFAYLADVFVTPAARGRGVSKFIMECILSHPELQHLRRMCLATLDAHGLYAQYGFKPFAQPDRWMEINRPGLYKLPPFKQR